MNVYHLVFLCNSRRAQNVHLSTKRANEKCIILLDSTMNCEYNTHTCVVDLVRVFFLTTMNFRYSLLLPKKGGLELSNTPKGNQNTLGRKKLLRFFFVFFEIGQ